MVNPRVKEQAEKDRQERLAYVGALAAGLVHEVRNPLHVIQLNVQMLAEDVNKLPAELRSRYERRSKRIYQEVQALSKTLEMFLTFARPPRLATEPIDLNHFLRELLEFVQPEFTDSGIELASRLASDMYPVLLDQNQFSHVVINLLRNAREAIEQRRERDGIDLEGRVTVRTFEDDKIIRIEIEDNGIGITPGDEEKIFEVFYTTKEKGTGLGLGIVRRIVEEHRGEIVAETGRTDGACFIVRLPRGHLLEFKAE